MFEQIPKSMNDNVVHWIKAVCPLVVYGVAKVREKAFAVLEMAEDAVLKHQKEICPIISSLISNVRKLKHMIFIPGYIVNDFLHPFQFITFIRKLLSLCTCFRLMIN